VSRAKTPLLQKKSNARLTCVIEKTDIILIMNEAWSKSFAHVLTNLKAIAECSWGPLNYNCLTNPEIQPKTTQQGNDQNNIVVSAHLPAPVAPPEQLNLMNGVAGTLIDKIIDLTNQDQAQTGVNAEEQAAH